MPRTIDNRLRIIRDHMLAKYKAMACTEGTVAEVYEPIAETSVYVSDSDSFAYRNVPDFTVVLLASNLFDRKVMPKGLTNFLELIGGEGDGTSIAFIAGDQRVPVHNSKLHLGPDGEKWFRLIQPAEALAITDDKVEEAAFYALALVPYYGAGKEVRT